MVSGIPRPLTGDHLTAKLAVLSVKSGREDLNLRPLEPHSSALAWLRYAPSLGLESLTLELATLGFAARRSGRWYCTSLGRKVKT